ncbi:hypothetical protein SAMD00019534_116240 [Acytostelium subglobosum LB1]|uniref:hypothetical protein n=1 Tax=Acytostelium subglobosum LB1 TaxID=1410327 RepID=UPI0006449AE9|nr:hypothetical protein SAMD00019534_116240 [Acytostelium subglobosum LB1]GAM28448.1 hypothetical protein SAMD00019534_116240 [Acytostelium subglobosum LB1]|eukprot:XP_012748487.1 hypothetical protein SAMD00019534_116240 [Acytostelium subglobosum LB1]
MTINKNKPITLDLCKLLPKAELHRHLDGSIRLTTLVELAKELDVKLPTFDNDKIGDYILKDKNCESLPHFLEAFQYTTSVLQTAPAISRVFYEMCEDACNDGVTYLEVRFAPVLHLEKGLSLAGVMEAVCDGLAQAEIRLRIKVRIIVCGLRHLDPSVTKDLAEIAWRYRSKGVVAFDLAGAENGFSSTLHKEAFALIRQKGVNCTLHSGEDSSWHSVADSIHHCGAHRIGHGIAVQENPSLLEYMVNRRIPIECCITSNLQIKGIPSLDAHPIRRYFDAGAVVALCTDNVTMSNITLSGEYKMAIDTFNFSVEEVVRLIDHAFSATFIEAPMKRVLRHDAVLQSIRLFKEHGYDVSGVLANKDYYLEAGIDVTGSPKNYHPIPSVTHEMLSKLPKADLHCRFEGSVSLDQMWQEVQLAKIDINKKFPSIKQPINDFNDFKNIIQKPHHDPETIDIAKRIMNTLLQTSDQLNRGFDNIINVALNDNVQYIEIVFRPSSHCQVLTQEQALAIIIAKRNQWEAEGNIKIGIVVYISADFDDPIDALAMAKLAVANRSNGVCGFGIFGNDPIPPNELHHYAKTIEYLRAESFNLVQFCGKFDIESIVSTIHVGGATRISGAFSIYKYPRMMNYLSAYSIPIELSQTDKLKTFTKDLSFTTPIRHLIDSNVPVVICSFRSSLYSSTRSDMLCEVVVNSQLNLKQVISLLRNPFTYNFQTYESKLKLKQRFNKLASDYLQSISINMDSLQ